jgi:hypothetical protein
MISVNSICSLGATIAERARCCRHWRSGSSASTNFTAPGVVDRKAFKLCCPISRRCRCRNSSSCGKIGRIARIRSIKANKRRCRSSSSSRLLWSGDVRPAQSIRSGCSCDITLHRRCTQFRPVGGKRFANARRVANYPALPTCRRFPAWSQPKNISIFRRSDSKSERDSQEAY